MGGSPLQTTGLHPPLVSETVFSSIFAFTLFIPNKLTYSHHTIHSYPHCTTLASSSVVQGANVLVRKAGPSSFKHPRVPSSSCGTLSHSSRHSYPKDILLATVFVTSFISRRHLIREIWHGLCRIFSSPSERCLLSNISLPGRHFKSLFQDKIPLWSQEILSCCLLLICSMNRHWHHEQFQHTCLLWLSLSNWPLILSTLLCFVNWNEVCASERFAVSFFFLVFLCTTT